MAVSWIPLIFSKSITAIWLEIREAMKSILADLKSFPGLKTWLLCFAATGILILLAWILMPDFIDLDSRPGPQQLLIAITVALVFPAIGEEVIFRGLLNQSQTHRSHLISTILFVLWHPIGAKLFLPAAFESFTDPRFLFFVACFGYLFCQMRLRSGSLWPPILCHWLIIIVWKGLGGARFLTE